MELGRSSSAPDTGGTWKEFFCPDPDGRSSSALDTDGRSSSAPDTDGTWKEFFCSRH